MPLVCTNCNSPTEVSCEERLITTWWIGPDPESQVKAQDYGVGHARACFGDDGPYVDGSNQGSAPTKRCADRTSGGSDTCRSPTLSARIFLRSQGCRSHWDELRFLV